MRHLVRVGGPRGLRMRLARADDHDQVRGDLSKGIYFGLFDYLPCCFQEWVSRSPFYNAAGMISRNEDSINIHYLSMIFVVIAHLGHRSGDIEVYAFEPRSRRGFIAGLQVIQLFDQGRTAFFKAGRVHPVCTASLCARRGLMAYISRNIKAGATSH